MAEKNTSEELEKGGSEEIIERLDSSLLDEGEDEVDTKVTDDQQMDDQSIDHLFQDKDKTVDRSMDHLFQDEDKTVDPSIDRLFDEDRKNFEKALQDEVQKALSQPEISKASLYRMRTKEPTEIALTKEIAKQKTVEEIWEESKDEASGAGNRKSIIVMCVFISLITMAGGWALWQTINDERGNEENLTALENESKEKELEKSILYEELSGVSEVIERYFSAITVRQKSECIYQAESFKNDIEVYYKNNGGVKPTFDYSIENIFPISLNGEDIWEVLIKEEDGLAEGIHSYFVRKNSDGEYKIDWESDVVLQENDVKIFKETRSREAMEIKFIVKPMKRGTYNWGFKDTEYKALRLVIPNSDMVFWGYVKKDSPEQKKLNDFIESDSKNSVLNQSMRHEFILKVRFLADSPRENDQYILIEDVVSPKWINIEE